VPDNPRSTARIAGHPIHPMLVPFPIACWVGALATDLTYANSEWHGWAYFSSWLIGAGLVTGGLAALAGFIDYFGERRIRALRVANWHMIGNLTAFVLSIVNFVIHMRDGAKAVLPTGLMLSALVVLILLVTGWLGGHLVYKHRVAVLDGDDRA